MKKSIFSIFARAQSETDCAKGAPRCPFAGRFCKPALAARISRTTIFAALILAFALLGSACSGQHAVGQHPKTDPEPSPLELGGSLYGMCGGMLNDAGQDPQTWKRLASTDYILAGERHTSYCDHVSQAIILKNLADAGTLPVLGLEMLTSAHADALKKFNRGDIGLDELPDALNWSKTNGLEFGLYRPLFEVAERYGIPVTALNVPSAVTREARARGLAEMSGENRALLPEKIIPPSAEQKIYLERVFNSHMAHLSQPAKDHSPVAPELERFILAQSIWDSSMAEKAVRARLEYRRPVFIAAGIGHVEFGWGIALRLKKLDPGAEVALVAPWHGQSHRPDQPKRGKADLYYYCPDE